MFLELINNNSKEKEAVLMTGIYKLKSDGDGKLTRVYYKESLGKSFDTFDITYKDLLEKLNKFLAPQIFTHDRVGLIERTESIPLDEELIRLRAKVEELQSKIDQEI